MLSRGQRDRWSNRVRGMGNIEVARASTRSAVLLLLRRCSQKVQRTMPISVRRPNVNPTASGITFDFGAIASVSIEIEVLAVGADSSPRRMLYDQRGRNNERKRESDARTLWLYSIDD